MLTKRNVLITLRLQKIEHMKNCVKNEDPMQLIGINLKKKIPQFVNYKAIIYTKFNWTPSMYIAYKNMSAESLGNKLKYINF